MAISDDFNSLADGAALSSDPDWNVWQASGTGVPTTDQHDDHSDGSQVVDMSNTGNAFAIYQTTVGGDDHFAELDVFLDVQASGNDNVGGVILRGSASSMGSGTFDGYLVSLDRDGANNDVYLRIYRVDGDVLTQIASSVDIHGDANDASSSGTTATVRGEIEGDTITGFSDDVELVSTTDSTHTTGQFCGLRLARTAATTSSQPFVDNFTGDTIGGGGGVEASGSAGVTLSIAATAAKTAGSAAALSVDLDTGDDAAKSGQAEGGSTVDLAVLGQVVKAADAAGAVGVDLSIAGEAAQLLQRTAAAILAVDLGVEGVAVKDTTAQAVLDLAVALAADPTKATAVAAELGLSLDTVGAASAADDGSVAASLSIALAVVASAVKAASTAGTADVNVAIDATGSKHATAAAALTVALGVDGTAAQAGPTEETAAGSLGLAVTISAAASKSVATITTLDLVLAIAAQAGDNGAPAMNPTATVLPSAWSATVLPSSWSARAVPTSETAEVES